MKDLAKSVARFSWAMSVFGARQLANVVSDEEDQGPTGDRVRTALDDVSKATAGELDDRFKSLYEAGDRMQGEMIDIAFSLFDPRSMAKRTSKLFHRAADAVEEMVPDSDADGDEGEAASQPS